MHDSDGVLFPPATYYGAMQASPDFVPVAGMTVTAWVNGNACAQGHTLKVGDQIAYSIHVFADGAGTSGYEAIKSLGR